MNLQDERPRCELIGWPSSDSLVSVPLIATSEAERRMQGRLLRHSNLRRSAIEGRRAIGSLHRIGAVSCCRNTVNGRSALWEWSRSLGVNDIIEGDFSATSRQLPTKSVIMAVFCVQRKYCLEFYDRYTT